MTKYDFLITYAPPYQLMDWLCTVFEAKRTKGEPVPEAYEAWLQTWRDTLADTESQLIADLDTVMGGEQLELVSDDEKKLFSHVGKWEANEERKKGLAAGRRWSKGKVAV